MKNNDSTDSYNTLLNKCSVLPTEIQWVETILDEIQLLAGFAFTGLIIWLTVVPFVQMLVKTQQLTNNTRVPFPSLPVIKNRPIDEGGINCLPQDQKLMEKYLDGQHRQI